MPQQDTVMTRWTGTSSTLLMMLDENYAGEELPRVHELLALLTSTADAANALTVADVGSPDYAAFKDQVAAFAAKSRRRFLLMPATIVAMRLTRGQKTTLSPAVEYFITQLLKILVEFITQKFLSLEKDAAKPQPVSSIEEPVTPPHPDQPEEEPEPDKKKKTKKGGPA